MKILIFSEQFCYNTTTFIYNEVIEFSKKNEVRYVCCKRINEDLFPYDDVVEIPYKPPLFTRKMKWYLEINDVNLNFYNAGFSEELNRVIDSFNPDVIHCHFGYEALKLLDNLKRTDIPVVVTFHGYDASFKLRRKTYVDRLRDILQKEYVYAILVCEQFRRNFSENNIPSEHARVLYCGINADAFKRQDYTPRKSGLYRFVQVASFTEKKGQLYTLRAFKKLLDRNPGIKAELILAGDGPYSEQVKHLANRLNLVNHIQFTGFLSSSQAKNLLEIADCFVHHSITAESGDTEGCTNSIMEAMAMELPVISTWHGGIPEMIDDENHGFLIEEKNIDDYADKMERVMSWSFLKENRERVLRQFNLDKHIYNLYCYLEEIAADNKSKKGAAVKIVDA